MEALYRSPVQLIDDGHISIGNGGSITRGSRHRGLLHALRQTLAVRIVEPFESFARQP